MCKRQRIFFVFSSRRRHTRWPRDWSSDVCSSDLGRWARRQRISTAEHAASPPHRRDASGAHQSGRIRPVAAAAGRIGRRSRYRRQRVRQPARRLRPAGPVDPQQRILGRAGLADPTGRAHGPDGKRQRPPAASTDSRLIVTRWTAGPPRRGPARLRRGETTPARAPPEPQPPPRKDTTRGHQRQTPHRRPAMIGRSATLLVAAVVGIAMLCVGGLIGLAGGASACTPRINPSATASGATSAPVSRYDSEQLTNAALIVSVGAGRGIPPRGLIIAVATALQESSLRNLGDQGEGNNHDSLGLFQQRPSQGWGTADQIMDPVYASNTFYDKLLTIPGWEQLPLTEAAQAVQRSAHPDAYAKWEPDATALVGLTVGMYGGCNGGDGMSGAGEALPADFTVPPDTPLPVSIAISWALQQLGTPYTFGGDCTDPHSGDPAKHCDCSTLVILSSRRGQCYDLRRSVEDTVVDAALVDTEEFQTVGGTVAKLQSLPAAAAPTRVCDREVAR